MDADTYLPSRNSQAMAETGFGKRKISSTYCLVVEWSDRAASDLSSSKSSWWRFSALRCTCRCCLDNQFDFSFKHLKIMDQSQAGQDLPVTLICKLVRTKANSVALNITVPSLFRGMFMETSFWISFWRKWTRLVEASMDLGISKIWKKQELVSFWSHYSNWKYKSAGWQTS